MADGIITIQDVITDEALKWGDEYAKNVDLAINKNNQLVAAALQLKAVYTQLQGATNLSQLAAGQTAAANASKKAADAYADRAKALAQVDKERQRQLQNLLTTENRLQNVNSITNKQLQEKRELLRQEERAIKKELTYMGQLEQKRYIALQQVQNLNAKKALGNRLSAEEANQLQNSTKEFKKYNDEFKKIKTGVGDFGFNVGNYPKGLEIVGGAIKKLLPGLGLLAGLKFGVDFVNDARKVAQEAKGVEFAFKRLGDTGVDAFSRIKSATRGTLSDLDIKTALVDFDNFNISLEETDTLFEFLAVRAAQTGKSVEYLQQSLVEGLSKESKLRIDNLGISATELNKELEKTPNFVQAVANIAKKEVAEAGSILDEAGNAQSRWNAALENFTLAVGNGGINKISDGFFDFGTNILRAITPTRELTSAIKQEQVELNTLATSILNTNDDQEKRNELIDQLTEQYPFFLKFIDDEKVGNDALKKGLAEINSLYIKRLALQRFIDKIDVAGKQNKLADETGDLAKVTGDYQTVLNAVNLQVNKGVLNTDIATKSLEDQNKILKQNVEANIVRLSQLKGQDKATDAQLRNLARYEKLQAALAEGARVFASANSQFGFAETAVADVNAEVKKLEEQLGITKTELDQIFDSQEVVITVNLDPEARAKAIKQAQEDAFNYKKALLEAQIKTQKELAENELADTGNRLIASKEYTNKSIELLDLERARAIQLAAGRSNEIKRIEVQYASDYQTIVKEREANAEVILKSAFEAAKRRIEERKKLEETIYNNKIEPLKAQFDIEINDPSISAKDRLKAVKEFEETVLEIKRAAAIEALQIQVDQIGDELESDYLTFEQRKSLELQLTELKVAQSNLRTETTIENLKKEAEAEEKIQAFKTEKIREASQVIADNLDLDAKNIETLIAGIVDGFDNALEGIQAAFSILGDVANSVFQSNIDAIDEQMEASEDYYNQQYELAEGDEELQKAIEVERLARQKELEAKKRKEQEKQAKYNKALAIVDIGIATALAIMKAFAQLGPIAGIPAAALVGALGAIQIAAVLAKPIPKYEHGTDNHPGGPAWVGEKRPEIVKEPGKSAYRVTHPTKLNLAPKTVVYSTEDEYRRALEGAAAMASFESQAQSLNAYDTAKAFDYSNAALLKEMQLTREAIEAQETNVNVVTQKGPDLPYAFYRKSKINWDN